MNNFNSCLQHEVTAIFDPQVQAQILPFLCLDQDQVFQLWFSMEEEKNEELMSLIPPCMHIQKFCHNNINNNCLPICLFASSLLPAFSPSDIYNGRCKIVSVGMELYICFILNQLPLSYTFEPLGCVADILTGPISC